MAGRLDAALLEELVPALDADLVMSEREGPAEQGVRLESRTPRSEAKPSEAPELERE